MYMPCRSSFVVVVVIWNLYNLHVDVVSIICGEALVVFFGCVCPSFTYGTHVGEESDVAVHEGNELVCVYVH